MKRIFATVLLVIGIVGLLDAQTVISNESMTHDGTDVTVSFDVDTDVKGLPSNRKEVIMPYIYNGADTVFLDIVEVYGKGRYKRERQVNHINGDKDWELGENQTLKGDVYEYVAQVPLKRWMKSANLGIRRQIIGCACEKDMEDENVVQGVPLFEEPVPAPRRLPEYVLADASRQWDFGQDELEIIFKVSKIEIDSSVFNNEVTFGKILEAVDKIHSNPHYRVDKIHIGGYASPEGSTRFNRWLGINRAMALVDYIIEHRPQYGLTYDNFEIHNGEENWQGLKGRLAGFKMDQLDEVLRIIDSDVTDAEKKTAIKALGGGRIWKKMLEEIYPHLRCARYLAVYYDSSDDHAVEVINEANVMIREGNYAQAYDHVKRYDDDMRAFNTIGVALMMQGRFEEAMPWFEKALDGNCPSARKNIDAINAEYEYERQQREELENYLKKYE